MGASLSHKTKLIRCGQFIEEVQGTIDWAKDKLEAFPKAKKDLGPLLDALGQPITQIVGGVALLLAGVLNLLGNLVSLAIAY